MKRPRLLKMRPSEPIPPAKLQRMAKIIREKRQKQLEEAAKAAEAEQLGALCNGSGGEGAGASGETDGEGSKVWAGKDGQVVNESCSNGHAQAGEEEEEEEEEEVPSEAALAEMQEELEALQNKKHLLFVRLKEMLREEASVKAAEDEQKRQQSEQEAEAEAEQEQEMRADEQGRSEADDPDSLQEVSKTSQSCQPSNCMSMRAHSAACSASSSHSSFSRRQMLPARTSPLQRRQQLAAKEAQMHQLALEPHLGAQMLPRPRQQLLRPFQHALNRMPHEFNDPQLAGQPAVTGVSLACSQWSRPSSINSCNRPSTNKCMAGGGAGIGHSDMRSAPSLGGAWAGWGMQPHSPGAALQCAGGAAMSSMGSMAGGRSCGPPPPPPLPPQASGVHLQQQLHQPAPQAQQPMQALQAQQQHKVPPPPPPPPPVLQQQLQSQRPRVRPPPPPPPPPNVLGRGGGTSLFSGPFSQQPSSAPCSQPQPQSTMPPATSMFQLQHQLKPQQQMKQTHVILQQHEQWLKQQQRARNAGVPQPGLPQPKPNHWIWRGQQ